MDNITLVQANSSHAALLTELSLTTFREAFEKDNNPEDFKTYVDQAFSPEQIMHDLQESGSIFYIAYVKGEPAGYARLRESKEAAAFFPGQQTLELHRLYALRKHIGKGVGKTIMQHCLTIAKEKGADILWLGVWEHNLHAQRFYQNFGFEKFSSHVFMVGSDAQTDFLLKRKL